MKETSYQAGQRKLKQFVNNIRLRHVSAKACYLRDHSDRRIQIKMMDKVWQGGRGEQIKEVLFIKGIYYEPNKLRFLAWRKLSTTHKATNAAERPHEWTSFAPQIWVRHKSIATSGHGWVPDRRRTHTGDVRRRTKSDIRRNLNR